MIHGFEAAPPVPEPGTFALIGAALVSVMAMWGCRRPAA